MRPLLRREPAPPPVLSALPPFVLVSAEGTPFGSEELEGRVWIAHFFFTRCVAICPRLVASVGRLRERLDAAGLDEIRIVGVTVDPDHDGPAELAAYAAVHGIDPASWTLLTGEPDEIRRVAVLGFKVPLGEAQASGGGIVDIAHTGKLVLVDGAGGIRGYYDSDELGLDEVFHRARHVLEAAR
jgi:protein SCO1/2